MTLVLIENRGHWGARYIDISPLKTNKYLLEINGWFRFPFEMVPFQATVVHFRGFFEVTKTCPSHEISVMVEKCLTFFFASPTCPTFTKTLPQNVWWDFPQHWIPSNCHHPVRWKTRLKVTAASFDKITSETTSACCGTRLILTIDPGRSC